MHARLDALGYDLPRTVAVLGNNRPDLARELTSDDFDGISDVWIDPETLMPMPRALRLFLLQDMMAQGLMSPQEYRSGCRLAGHAPSRHQTKTTKPARVAWSRRFRQTANPIALPLLYQDNEAIHQDILERELILPDDTPPPVRQAAAMRWEALARQAMMKMGGVLPTGTNPQQSGSTSQSHQSTNGGTSLNAQDQPLLSLGNPSNCCCPG